MADQTINIRFKNKYDTEESWIKNNPVLLNGELAFSSDKQGYYKIGNGKSSWSDLKYAFYNNIVDLSVNGRTITYQRVDGSKGSFTTQDTNTVYGVVNENNNGLMTPTLFTKLNNIQDGANKYVLPVASNTVLGGVKIGANLTNSSGTISLTKTNIVSALGYTPPTTNTTYGLATSTANGLIKIGYATNGKNYPVVLDSEGKAYVNVPWTDTNTTYTLDSFSITATAAELNHTKGVTSNIQTQLNSKASSGHTHNYAGSSSAGGSANSAVKLTTPRNINGVAFDGTANINVLANPITTTLTNQNLNDVGTPGFYNASGGNTVTNKPSGIDAFGLVVVKSASNYTTQICIGGNNIPNKIFIRRYDSNAWTNWEYLYSTAYKPTKADVGLSSVDNTADSTKSVKYAASAGTANALGTNAGTTTQPVYFSSGKPVVCGFTVETSVPKGAKFTDTIYTHPAHTAYTSGLYKITTNTLGHITAATPVTKNDIVSLGIPGSIPIATASSIGGIKSGGDITVSSTGTITINASTKLRSTVKIGNANFDGSKNITLSEMGVINPIEITKVEFDNLKASGQLNMSAYYNIIDDFDAVGIINDTTSSANQVFSSQKTEAVYAKKSTIVDTVLSASDWTGSVAPFTYTLSVNGVTATSVNEISYKYSNNNTQITAYQNALLRDGGQSAGKIILKATGTKPTVDIPITIIVRHDV